MTTKRRSTTNTDSIRRIFLRARPAARAVMDRAPGRISKDSISASIYASSNKREAAPRAHMRMTGAAARSEISSASFLAVDPRNAGEAEHIAARALRNLPRERDGGQ